MPTASFTHAFTVEGSAPEWIHLLPTGQFSSADGRGPFVVGDPEKVIAQFNADGAKLPIDINHSIDRLSASGGSTPAQGWIVELQDRETGMWGRVEWTKGGRHQVEERAYGFISPVFLHTKKKPQRIDRILRAALTNSPGLTQLESLLTREESTMDDEELRTALGLSADASDADVLTAARTAHQASTSYPALLTRIAEAAGVEETLTGDALIDAIKARDTDADEAGETAALRTELNSVRKELTEVVTSHAQERAVAVIDEAIEAGKIVPALRNHMVSRHTKNPTEVDTEIAAMPSINGGGLGARGDPPKKGELGESDRAVCRLMGLDPEEYKKTLENEQKEAV